MVYIYIIYGIYCKMNINIKKAYIVYFRIRCKKGLNSFNFA